MIQRYNIFETDYICTQEFIQNVIQKKAQWLYAKVSPQNQN
jgi:hypothetical protein